MAESAARWVTDVGLIRWRPENETGPVGYGRRHCAYTWGDATRKSGEFEVLYGMDPLAALDMWCLCGDGRALDALDVYAARYNRAKITPASTSAEDPGWTGGPAMYLASEIPSRRKYRAQGEALLAGEFKKDEQGRPRFILNSWGFRSQEWVMGLIMYQASADDPRVKEAFPELVKWLVPRKEWASAEYMDRPTLALGYMLSGDAQIYGWMDEHYLKPLRDGGATPAGDRYPQFREERMAAFERLGLERLPELSIPDFQRLFLKARFGCIDYKFFYMGFTALPYCLAAEARHQPARHRP
jgi:hypothetical protein